MWRTTFLFFLFSCSTLITCTSEPPVIMSVTGPIPAEELGVTLPHEHVLVDFIGADSTGYHRWNRAEVIRRVLPYLTEAKAAGVSTMMECTPAYLGRDPKLLAELAWQSGLNIVTNTGFYGAVHDKYLPQFVFSATVDSIASIWIDESEKGIEDSGVRPGFIKIAVDSDPRLSEVDEKVVRAAARTHKETGLTIVSHTGPDGPAMAQLEILAEEGISPSAFVWTHAQQGSPEGHVRAAQKGAWISLDNVHADSASIRRYVQSISNLKQQGLLDHVLISHDAGWYSVGEQNGGDFRGYTDIFTDLLPALKRVGVSEDEIRQLLVENPREAFTVRIRRD